MPVKLPPASRVLITGAGGFVGRWLRQALIPVLSADACILSIGTRPSEIKIYSDLESSVTVDIRDERAVDALIGRFNPSAIIHLAAISDVREASRAPRTTWEVNFCGTMNLAYSALRHSPKARFIFVSSSEVYGDAFGRLNRPVDENARLEPTNPYATSKAAADLLLGQLAREGLKVIRFRPFNHTGPGQTDRFVIPAFATQIARIKSGLQQPILRVGNLDARRDFLDVRDVVDAYVLALALPDKEWEAGAILNLASGIPRRIGEILDALIALADVSVRIEQDAARIRVNDTLLAIGDATAARRILGWVPQVPWEVTLRDLVASLTTPSAAYVQSASRI
jgi:GDP-4-dehydro-6-deoxy-D-mannose reductase